MPGSLGGWFKKSHAGKGGTDDINTLDPDKLQSEKNLKILKAEAREN